MRQTLHASIPVVLVAAATGHAQTSLFNTVGGQLQARAEIPGLGSNNAFLTVVMPGPGANTASVGPFVSSTVGYSFTENLTQSTFDITFSHNCGYPTGGSRASTFSGANFTVAAPTPYAVSGIISMPLGAPTATINMQYSLLPQGGGPAIFRHETTRSLAGGSSIILGAPISGDILTGSPTGTVIPGTTYIVALTLLTITQTIGAAAIPSGSFTIDLGVDPCRANCDGSTTTPVLTPNDFQCFLNAYAAGLSSANCDGSTTTPMLTPNDFQCFINQYAAGCS
jgi:hypothetical protein